MLLFSGLVFFFYHFFMCLKYYSNCSFPNVHLETGINLSKFFSEESRYWVHLRIISSRPCMRWSLLPELELWNSGFEMLIQTTGVWTFCNGTHSSVKILLTVPLHENRTILVRRGHGRVHSHSYHDGPRTISFAKLETQFENYWSKICYLSHGCFKVISDWEIPLIWLSFIFPKIAELILFPSQSLTFLWKLFWMLFFETGVS